MFVTRVFYENLVVVTSQFFSKVYSNWFYKTFTVFFQNMLSFFKFENRREM